MKVWWSSSICELPCSSEMTSSRFTSGRETTMTFWASRSTLHGRSPATYTLDRTSHKVDLRSSHRIFEYYCQDRAALNKRAFWRQAPGKVNRRWLVGLEPNGNQGGLVDGFLDLWDAMTCRMFILHHTFNMTWSSPYVLKWQILQQLQVHFLVEQADRRRLYERPWLRKCRLS